MLRVAGMTNGKMAHHFLEPGAAKHDGKGRRQRASPHYATIIDFSAVLVEWPHADR
ncbi:hypothetical protein [Ancylobacter defluvii]|uniref:Uncharacterized protein n=1 Tax=Ancylobacter defluvii TaxID=1282440 RepID=A0A9W6NB40_9HYPH|nr:hypothetical protein [Ancylobacter defluvii]MBS7585817.1 hypothetical protein [Ancylobacter defluvii]GLK84190.1 hypothetical protein GCM10017653_22600 [Ancylobacter defluvii]